jgi:hypothetical protein
VAFSKAFGGPHPPPVPNPSHFFREITDPDNSDEYKLFLVKEFIGKKRDQVNYDVEFRDFLSFGGGFSVGLTVSQWICLNYPPEVSASLVPSFFDPWKIQGSSGALNLNYTEKMYFLNHLIETGNLAILRHVDENDEIRRKFHLSHHGSFRGRVVRMAAYMGKVEILDWMFANHLEKFGDVLYYAYERVFETSCTVSLEWCLEHSFRLKNYLYTFIRETIYKYGVPFSVEHIEYLRNSLNAVSPP